MTGDTGPTGAAGAPGADGADGVGVPLGGTTGQVLTKASATDLDTTWTTPAGGGSFAAVTLTDSGTPATPPAGELEIFARKIAGRLYAAQIGPSGFNTALQPLLARNKVAWAQPIGNATTLHVMGIVLSSTGTVTTANVATTNILTALRRLEYAVTTASATAIAGFRSARAQYFLGSGILGGFTHIVRFGRSRGVAANATLRCFVGLSSLTAAPTDTEPSTTVTNAIGVCADAADTNYQIITRNGTGVATKVDTGIPKAVADNTEAYELAIFTAPGSLEVSFQFTRLSDGTTFEHTTSATLPAATTLLAQRGYYSVGGTLSVIGLAFASLYTETDY